MWYATLISKFTYTFSKCGSMTPSHSLFLNRRPAQETLLEFWAALKVKNSTHAFSAWALRFSITQILSHCCSTWVVAKVTTFLVYEGQNLSQIFTIFHWALHLNFSPFFVIFVQLFKILKVKFLFVTQTLPCMFQISILCRDVPIFLVRTRLWCF